MVINFKKTALFLSMLFLFTSNSFGEAGTIIQSPQTNQSNIIKIGFFENKYFMEHNNGNVSGYAIEYLEEIKKYTNWEYEYVEDSWPNLYTKLQKGEIDFMPGLSFTNERNKLFGFPHEKMGTEAYYIYKRSTDFQISSLNEKSLEDKRIGITRNTLLYDYFLIWQENTNVNCKILFYDSNAEKQEALLRGIIDAMCDTSDNIKANSGIVPVFQIGYSDYYLACTKTKPELLNELNSALYELEQNFPGFRNYLHHKYYSNTAVGDALIDYSKTKSQKTQDFIRNNTILIFEILISLTILLIIFISIYIHLTRHKNQIQKRDQIVINQQMDILQSFADVYLTTHLFNLKDNTFQAVKSITDLNPFENFDNGNESLKAAMINRSTEPFLDHVLNFCDLTTLPDRMQGKKSISTEFVGKFSGWCRLSFVTIKKDETNKPTEVLFTVKVIEEEKSNEEFLKQLSITDKLTGLENRNSYETTIKKLEEEIDYSRTVFVMDLDGLKITNDKYGHDAGDEIIIGSADIIKTVFGEKGKCYRLGGDEFCVIISADKLEIDTLCEQFNNLIENWSGNIVDSLHISYGYVSAYEYSDYSIKDLFKVADTRMYQAKRKYYESSSKDRRTTTD